MKKGAITIAYINEFNNIISRLASMDIVFDDEVQTLLLLSSLPKSWLSIVTTVKSSTRTTKFSFEGLCESILSEVIHMKNSGESSGFLLSTDSRGRKTERGSNHRG